MQDSLQCSIIITVRKVMFSGASVILFTGGAYVGGCECVAGEGGLGACVAEGR